MDPYNTQRSLSADDFFGNSRDLSLQKFVKRVKKKWWYFQISLPICLLLAFAYTHFTIPKYLVGTKLVTPEQNVGNSLGGDAQGQNFTILEQDRNILNEAEKLKSFTLAQEVANTMNLEVSYFLRKRMVNIEEHGSSPYKVNLDRSTHQILDEAIEIEFIDANTYGVSISADEFWAMKFDDGNQIQAVEPFSFKGVCQYGKECETRFFKFTVTLEDWAKKELIGNQDRPKRFFKINSPESIAQMIHRTIEVSIPVEDATVLSISMETPQTQKGIDILNSLTKAYQNQRLAAKNEFIEKQIAFIDEQLGTVKQDLSGIEGNMADVAGKSSLNAQVNAGQLEAQIRTLTQQLADEQLKYQYLQGLQSNVESGNTGSLSSPAGIGITDPVLTGAILELQELNNKKLEITYRAPLSPELDVINKKIEASLSSLKGQLGGLVTQARSRVSSIRGQIGNARAQINRNITGEIQKGEVDRQMAITSEMYQLLQKKRTEAIIAKEANVSDIQVLESARLLDPKPVSPNIPLTLALAIFAGLFIPLAIMVGQEYFVSKIEDINDLGNYTGVPVITSVPHGSGNDVLRTGSIDKVTLESFRFLKLKLMGLAEDENFQVVSVTSYIPSEGKNYCATNLATAIAVAGKKVIMLDADMRKLPVYYSKSIGLSEYLNDQTTLEEIIQQTDVENLYYITSGEIADRPTELLESRNMKDLLMQLKTEFDYIVINTPPVGIVSDLFVLSKHVDISLFVVRHNYTPIEHLGEIDKIREVTGIRETYIIYNDVDKEADKYRRYGQNYGYLGGAYEEITINQNGARKSSIKN